MKRAHDTIETQKEQAKKPDEPKAKKWKEKKLTAEEMEQRAEEEAAAEMKEMLEGL